MSLVTANLAVFFSGLGLGLSLIIAIGAQNAYVLRQGARREHLTSVLLVCILSDIALILAGVAGLGVIIEYAPWAITAMRWFGAAFLLCYGLLAARRALWPTGAVLDAQQADARRSEAQRPETQRTSRLVSVTLTALALTWLNPHVYLDTVILLGSVANTHGADARWVFALGACLGSVLWFSALGLGARLLSRWLNSPTAWRILDGIIAVVMLALAVSLVVSR